MRLHLSILNIVVVLGGLHGCGGGGGDSDSSSPSQPSSPMPTISNAATFKEVVDNQLARLYTPSSVNLFRGYDADFPAAAPGSCKDSLAQPTTIVYAYASSGQGLTPVYPQPNGAFTIRSTIAPRVYSLRGMDLTNGQDVEGEARLYYGVKGRLANGTFPILFVIESLVSLRGAPQYRAFQIFEGVLAPCGSPQSSLFAKGNYAVNIAEAFNGGATGVLPPYPYVACWASVGFSSGSTPFAC